MKTNVGALITFALLVVVPVTAHHKNAALEQFLQEIRAAHEKVDKRFSLAQKQRIFVADVRAEHDALFETNRYAAMHAPSNEPVFYRQAYDRNEAKVRQRFHVAQDELGAIKAEGYAGHWPRT